MDLQIILDASSSRKESEQFAKLGNNINSNFNQVFEHQRELALSLIERLPISADGAQVAVGINSFTSTGWRSKEVGSVQ
ncbi:unnamed protein product [Strongylus vulgaris]|uniref:VWFA domain-containing protein n=1 Tax=Strongylus vulgaris TaxID=40348 RepID=A0A3P7L381_STRVU|nr:unnamed protein product [Strongylus vulgaris]